jgi:hypothetical protein
MTCVNEDMRKMIGNIESLAEIWETVVTCYARLEKYIAEALKPVVEFRKYTVQDTVAVRFLLFAAEGRQPGDQGHGAPEDAHQ